MNFIKYGVFLLFGSFVHYSIVMMYSQWLMLQNLETLGSGGPVGSHVFTGFPIIFRTELIVAAVLLVLGTYQMLKKNRP